MNFIRKTLLIALLCSMSLLSVAQEKPYPNRPINWIIPMSAGGTSDTFARTIQPFMTNYLGQTMVIENKPGANGENPEETTKLQQQLFDLVVTKDNVGEAMWYIYTGLLVTSVVQLNISTKGCKKSVKTMEETAARYKEQQEKAKEEASIGAGQIYTL